MATDTRLVPVKPAITFPVALVLLVLAGSGLIEFVLRFLLIFISTVTILPAAAVAMILEPDTDDVLKLLKPSSFTLIEKLAGVAR